MIHPSANVGFHPIVWLADRFTLTLGHLRSPQCLGVNHHGKPPRGSPLICERGPLGLGTALGDRRDFSDFFPFTLTEVRGNFPYVPGFLASS